MSKIQIITDPEEMHNRFQEQLDNFKDSLISELRKEMQLQKPEEYLNKKEVSKMLKISSATLDEWTKKGKLTSYKIYGRRLLYKRSEIEQSLTAIKQ